MGVVTTKDNDTWRLSQINVFDDLSSDQMEEIIALAQPLQVARDEILFSPDEEAGSIYLLRSGKVKLSKVADDGKEITMAILQAGDVFGEFAIAGADTQDLFAEVVEDASLYVIPWPDLEALIGRKPQVALMLVRALSERLRRAESQIEDLVFRSVPERVASLVLKLAEEHGRVSARGITIDLRLTHQDIANMVGATRETVTNVLNDLRSAGAIEIEQKHVRVLDQAALEVASGAVRP
ncbi:MAG: Crp/Fnr family transcriptional regulator [Armatimonadota bacterium]